MSDKMIRSYVEWVREGKIKYKPVRWAEDSTKVFRRCPFCGIDLKWKYAVAENQLDEYEVYGCETCDREWTSRQLLDVETAFQVLEGQNPYAGAIFVQTDAYGDQDFYRKEWNFDEPTEK